jgi:hypothetical protein
MTAPKVRFTPVRLKTLPPGTALEHRHETAEHKFAGEQRRHCADRQYAAGEEEFHSPKMLRQVAEINAAFD